MGVLLLMDCLRLPGTTSSTTWGTYINRQQSLVHKNPYNLYIKSQYTVSLISVGLGENLNSFLCPNILVSVPLTKGKRIKQKSRI